MKIKAGIIGGAGYTGGELIRLLIHHPYTDISFIHSKSSAGKPVHAVHGDLLGDTDLFFSEKIHDDVDVLFLCVGHGDAVKFLEENQIKTSVKIIDLSQDFRLTGKSAKRNFVYGLPEINREQIRKASNVANPGCFATSIQLGLLPLAKEGLLREVHSTGITGSTGAGQGFSDTSHFSWRANNVQAYKSLTHQHLKEINRTLRQLQPDFAADEDKGIHFIPWRGDFTRGIFVSSQLSSDLSQKELEQIFADYYRDHPFTHLSTGPIFLKQVVNTNKCLIQLEKVGTKIVIHTIIDNLLKGASGQAVQNMNLMFGLDECAGLELKANYF